MTTPDKHIAIFGATSAIAQAAAKIWMEQGYRLWLCGRDSQKLEAIRADLAARGAKVQVRQADLDQVEDHPALVEETLAACPNLEQVLFAQGVLGEAETCRQDWQAAQAVIHTNFLSICSLLTPFANWFEARKHGSLGVISSVAGDRGRQSLYVYCASKAGLDSFLSGLRNRLQPSGVSVVTIKPGFVKTPMTAHLRQGFLFASPERIAKGLTRAMAKGKNIVYLPWFWRYIMLIIRCIPEPIFKRLRL